MRTAKEREQHLEEHFHLSKYVNDVKKIYVGKTVDTENEEEVEVFIFRVEYGRPVSFVNQIVYTSNIDAFSETIKVYPEGKTVTFGSGPTLLPGIDHKIATEVMRLMFKYANEDLEKLD